MQECEKISKMNPDKRKSYQEWHFSIGLDPNFIPGVRSNDIQRCDVQSEFPRFGKFAYG